MQRSLVIERMCYNYLMPKRSSKKDENQLAKSVIDQIIAETESEDFDKKKNSAAVMLGRRGGLKGGKARAAQMTKAELVERAKKAAAARWNKKKN